MEFRRRGSLRFTAKDCPVATVLDSPRIAPRHRPPVALPRQKVADRMEVISRYLPDRLVLDVGCVDSRPAREGARSRIERKPDLLYQRILQMNPGTVGVDIDEAGVQMLQERGHQAVCADVE